MRSGKLIATNDKYIEDLINDPDYRILEDGTILTLIQNTGKRSVCENWRELIKFEKNSKRVLKPYYCIAYKNKKLLLHRVMYAKFVGKLEQDLVINHKDGNPSNNHFSNLELVTQSDNNKHGYRVMNRTPVIGNSVLNFEVAEQIRKDRQEGLKYSDICKKYNISKGHVSEIVNNKIWKSIPR